eukprot:65456-Pyramimonas_sp.AAC.1
MARNATEELRTASLTLAGTPRSARFGRSGVRSFDMGEFSWSYRSSWRPIQLLRREDYAPSESEALVSVQSFARAAFSPGFCGKRGELCTLTHTAPGQAHPAPRTKSGQSPIQANLARLIEPIHICLQIRDRPNLSSGSVCMLPWPRHEDVCTDILARGCAWRGSVYVHSTIPSTYP